MPARKPIKKLLLTTKMRKDRISFCKEHIHWTVEDWMKVMFSDESTFLQQDCQQQYVRCDPNSSKYDPRYTIKTVKNSPGVMVWACFAYKGAGSIEFIEKNKKMNSARHVDILSQNAKCSLKKLHCSIFQQDNATCHTSKISKAWFVDNKIEVLPWPGNSPDLNPIKKFVEIHQR